MNKKLLIKQFLVLLLPLIYLFYCIPNWPMKIPVHYKINGDVDRMGSKNELIFVLLFVTVLGILISMLVNNLKKIDPKLKDAHNGKDFFYISWLIILFLSFLSFIIIYTTNSYVNGHRFPINSKFIYITICILFIALGKLMKNIKPNYFLGIRTPWTLSDNNIWQFTHEFTSTLWVYGYLMISIFIFLSPTSITTIFFISAVIILSILPILYSYLIYKKYKKIIK